ncbi:MAG: Do family serine endopeptidase [Gemmatimonadota bacterium]|nr:Do family serine endopeptidase [Gemmatimonadota bacterium]
MHRRGKQGLARIAAPALAFLIAACAGDEQPRSAVAQEAMDHETQEAPTYSAPESVDLAGVNELSAAFRAASGRALPAVVFIDVEREASVAQLPFTSPFERFFDLPGRGVPEGQLPPQLGSGSGFIIDAAGQIVTNHHVVDGATTIRVRLNDGREFAAEVVGSDAATDIAVLEIDAAGESLPTVPWGDSDRLLVGDWVLALGNPLGLEFTVTSGIVSARGRQLNGGSGALESYIQTDAAINPGNSGGPLIDLAGNVVGINSAIYGGQRFVGYGFAVPSALAQRVIRDLVEYGFVRRPRLGVRVSDVTAVDAEAYGLATVTGADVNSVDPDSPAEDAGLEIGDVITSLDGEDVANSNALITALAQHDPGDEVTLTVFRDGAEREIEVRLGEFERPAESGLPVSHEESVENVTGIQVRPLTSRIAAQIGYEGDEGELVVANVQPYSPAARAGVRTGQVLLAVNRQPVRTPAEYERALSDVEPGSVVSLRVIDPEIGETIINFRTATR